MMRPGTTLSVLAAAGLLLAAGCSSDKSSEGTIATSTPTTAADTSTSTQNSMSSTSSDATETSNSTDDTGADDSTDTSLDLDQRATDVRAALEAGDFSTMLDLLELSGLSDELEGREVTVLAPSEEAFSQISAADLADIVTDVDRVKDLLRRHILDELYTYEELAQQTQVTTISDETLAVTTDGDTVMVDGAVVSPPETDSLAGEQGQEVAVFSIDQLLLDEG